MSGVHGGRGVRRGPGVSPTALGRCGASRIMILDEPNSTLARRLPKPCSPYLSAHSSNAYASPFAHLTHDERVASRYVRGLPRFATCDGKLPNRAGELVL